MTSRAVPHLRDAFSAGTVSVTALDHFRWGGGSLSEEDSVAEESVAGASVHVPFDHFDFRVDAFDGPVAVGKSESGDGRVVVLLQAAQEWCEFGDSGVAGLADPGVEVIASPRGEDRGEIPDQCWPGGTFPGRQCRVLRGARGGLRRDRMVWS